MKKAPVRGQRYCVRPSAKRHCERPSAKQLEAVKALQEKGWKLTKSKMYELSYGPTIGPRAPYATTRNEKINDVLQELWQKAA